MIYLLSNLYKITNPVTKEIIFYTAKQVNDVLVYFNSYKNQNMTITDITRYKQSVKLPFTKLDSTIPFKEKPQKITTPIYRIKGINVPDIDVLVTCESRKDLYAFIIDKYVGYTCKVIQIKPKMTAVIPIYSLKEFKKMMVNKAELEANKQYYKNEIY